MSWKIANINTYYIELLKITKYINKLLYIIDGINSRVNVDVAI